MSAPRLLAHRRDGSGPPVLLLNGGMMSIAAWEPIATALAASFSVLRCDLRGQLLSPGAAPHRLDAHVADVIALLDDLAVDRIHVIGTSFGAEVGVLLAARHPDRVASLVAATASDRFVPAMVSGVGTLRGACRAALAGGDRALLFDLMLPITYSEAFLARHGAALRARREQFATLPDAWFEGLDAILATLETIDLTHELARITCPTLVLSAGDDRIMPAERSAALAAGIRGARHEVVAGSGHGLVIEQGERFAARCARFIAAVIANQTSSSADALRPGGAEGE